MDAEQSAELTGTNRPCGLIISLRQTSSVARGIRIVRVPSRCPSCVCYGRGRYDPTVSGGDLEEATPDPIPNSEVKLLGADGTAREAVWESRTLPGFSSKSPLIAGSFFVRFPWAAAASRDAAGARRALP